MGKSQTTVFKGTYSYRIDAKGRLPVPAAFRRSFDLSPGSSLVVTLLDQCLAAYPPSEWTRVEDQLRAMPAFTREVKSLTRLLASRAADCELDVQGRILLPLSLRQAAALQREAVVIGVLDRFEIWNPENWAAFLRDAEGLLDHVGADLHWPAGPPRATASGTGTQSAREPRGSHRPQAKPKR